MKNNLSRFLLYFSIIFLGNIAIYSFLRLVIDLVDMFLTGSFDFSVPIELIYGSFIAGAAVAFILIFDK